MTRRLALFLPLSVLGACSLFQPAANAPDEGDAVSAPIDTPRIPAPDALAAMAPDGYRVEVILTDLTYPTSIDFGDNGTMYVAEGGYAYGDESAPARVIEVDSDGGYRIVADQLNGPVTDLLWHKGRLYISHRGKISVLDGSTVRDLVTGLPSLGDHSNNQMAAGTDGKIYFGQGTATNSGVVGVDNFLFLWLPKYPNFCDVPARDIKLSGETFATLNPMIFGTFEESKIETTAAFRPFGKGNPDDYIVKGSVKATGAILRMEPDGSNLEVYAWGMRNPFGVMWSTDGMLYVSDNGYDERGSRPIANAPDFVYQVKEGGWYGFPDYIGGVPVTDARFKPKEGVAPTFLMEEHPKAESPYVTLPVHCAPTKIDFSPGNEFGFEGHLFLAQFGDGLPMTGKGEGPRGAQVVRIDPRTKKVQPFFRVRPQSIGPKGAEYFATAGPKHPMDVRFSPDGKALYVVDFGAFRILPLKVPLPQPVEGTGAVWRITRSDATGLHPLKNMSMKPASNGAKGN